MEHFWQVISRNADPIQAVCAIATVVIAVVAAFIAIRQLKAGYRISREQAQPYVAVAMRSLDHIDSHFIEFFVRNFGQTAAFDVRVTSDPPLQQVWDGEEARPMWMFDVLPTLVPGDEWTQMLGFAPAHFTGGLPTKYTITVTWHDSAGESFTAKYMLDWNAHKDRWSINERTVHHLVATVGDVDKDLKGIQRILGKMGAA